MEQETFVKQAAYIVRRACEFSWNARREGLPALEKSIDARKADLRDVFEYGIGLALDGADERRIDETLSGLIDGERDEDARRLKAMQKEAVLSIHADENPYILELYLISRISDSEFKAMQELLPDFEMPRCFSHEIAAAPEAEEKTGLMGPGEFIEQLARVASKARELHIRAKRAGLLDIEDYIDTADESFGALNTMRRHIFVSGLRLMVDGTEDKIIDRILSNLIAHERDDRARRLKTIMKEAVLCILSGCHIWTLLSTMFSRIDDSEFADLLTALSGTDIHADMEPAMKMTGVTRHTEADNYYATVLNVGRELAIPPEAYLPELAWSLQLLARPPIEERRYEEIESIHAKLREVCRDLPNKAEYSLSGYSWKCDSHGIDHYEQGRYDLAIEDFDESLKFKPESASTHCWRGAAYYYQMRYDLAIADFSEAIRLKPDSASYYNWRGDAYYDQRQNDLAIKDYNEAIKLDPNNSTYSTNCSTVHYKRGCDYSRQSQYDLAIEDFSEAIRLKPNGKDAYNDRAKAYKEKGLHELAEKDLAKVESDETKWATWVLRVDEIDKLLAAINAEDTEPGDPIPDNERYNDPENLLLKCQTRASLSALFGIFSQLTASGLSDKLRLPVHVKAASVDLLTYEQFYRSVPTPTIFATVDMEPLKGCAIVEVDPVVAILIVNRLQMLAGDDVRIDSKLEPNGTAKRIMENVLAQLLDYMREAWKGLIDLRPSLERIDFDPSLHKIVQPKDAVVLVTIGVKVGDVESMINFCAPCAIIKPVLDAPSAAE